MPASTRSAGAFAADVDDVDEDSVDVEVCAELSDVSIVPVNSTFLPTCGMSAVGFAIRRYVIPVAAPAADGLWGLCGVWVLVALSGDAGEVTAFVRMNF